MVGDRGFRCVHRIGGRRHDDELRHVLVSEKPVLESGYRNVNRVVGTGHRTASRSFGLRDPYYPEIHVTHFDVASEGVGSSKKVRRGRRSEHRDLRAVLHVGFRNEHAVLGLDVLDFRIIAAHSVHGRRRIYGSDDDLFGGLGDRRNGRDSGERTNFLDVVDGEDVGTFHVGSANVALTVSTGPKREKIGSEGLDVRLDAPLRTLTESEEHYDRSDADDDSKTRKRRAHLIGTDASEGVEQMFEKWHAEPLTIGILRKEL